MDILSKIINDNANYPEQRSEEWLNMRKNIVGGSEIYKLFNNSEIKPLIKKKLGPPQKLNVFPCNWGIVFENVMPLIINQIFNTYPLEINMIRGKNNRQYYSPDGILTYNNKPYLLEYKCPISRTITNVVPDHYIKQMQYGMDASRIRSCLYMESAFKLCTYEQFNDTTEWSDIHTGTLHDDIIAKGKIYLSCNGYPNDIATLEFSEIKKVFSLIANEEIEILDISIEFINNRINTYGFSINSIESSLSDCEEYDSVIYWKMSDCAIHLIKRDKKYKNIFKTLLEKYDKIFKDLDRPQ